MNIRKPADYVTMFTTLDTLMAAQLPQMELYREIGRVVSGRCEKRRGCRGVGISATAIPQPRLLPQCAPYARVLRSLRGIP